MIRRNPDDLAIRIAKARAQLAKARTGELDPFGVGTVDADWVEFLTDKLAGLEREAAGDAREMRDLAREGAAQDAARAFHSRHAMNHAEALARFIRDAGVHTARAWQAPGESRDARVYLPGGAGYLSVGADGSVNETERGKVTFYPSSLYRNMREAVKVGRQAYRDSFRERMDRHDAERVAAVAKVRGNPRGRNPVHQGGHYIPSDATQERNAAYKAHRAAVDPNTRLHLHAARLYAQRTLAAGKDAAKVGKEADEWSARATKRNPRPAPAARAYRLAVLASRKAAERRRNLPPGSSRAAVTTANARWASAAEYRDLLGRELPADVRARVDAEIRDLPLAEGGYRLPNPRAMRRRNPPVPTDDYRSEATRESTPLHIWWSNVLDLAGVTHAQSLPYRAQVNRWYQSGEPAWMAADGLRLLARAKRR